MSVSDTAPGTDGPRVVTQRHGHVLLIRMRRPDKRNAVDAVIAGSDDRAEGIAAFLEKRPPRWQGT